MLLLLLLLPLLLLHRCYHKAMLCLLLPLVLSNLLLLVSRLLLLLRLFLLLRWQCTQSVPLLLLHRLPLLLHRLLLLLNMHRLAMFLQLCMLHPAFLVQGIIVLLLLSDLLLCNLCCYRYTTISVRLPSKLDFVLECCVPSFNCRCFFCRSAIDISAIDDCQSSVRRFHGPVHLRYAWQYLGQLTGSI